MLLTEFRVNLKKVIWRKQIPWNNYNLYVTVGHCRFFVWLTTLPPPFFARNPDGLCWWALLMGSGDGLWWWALMMGCNDELWWSALFLWIIKQLQNSGVSGTWSVWCMHANMETTKKSVCFTFVKSDVVKIFVVVEIPYVFHKPPLHEPPPPDAWVFFTDRKETTHVYEFYSLWPFNLTSQIVLKQLLQLLNVYYEVQVLLELCPISIGIVK